MHSIVPILEDAYLRLTNAVLDRWPVKKPSRRRLSQCRLISHRGEYGNDGIKENTLEAFQRAADAGVWGLEMDMRWTRDLIPVIIHDPDLSRLFRDDRTIGDLALGQLRAIAPTIPTLAETVARFGRRCHLMIEVKSARWPEPQRQNHILGDILSPLAPGTDFHLLALDTSVLAPITVAPREAMVPIASLWPVRLFRQVLTARWGGLCTHYTMMTAGMVRRLKDRGKAAGTGYADSVNGLYREAGRGIDWIFSNHAAALQSVLRSDLEYIG